MLNDEIWFATEGSVYIPTPCSTTPSTELAADAATAAGASAIPAAPRVAERSASLRVIRMRVILIVPFLQ
jgi:hypothetical protein